MRKSEKEITDKTEIEQILKKEKVCRLALCKDNQPYVVPLCYGYEDNTLYFHCARQGKKLDIIKANNNVCFEIESNCEIIEAEKPCDWTMKYKSIIGFGKAGVIKNTEAKIKGLNVLMKQFSGKTFQFPEHILNKTTIVKIEIKDLTAKRSD